MKRTLLLILLTIALTTNTQADTCRTSYDYCLNQSILATSITGTGVAWIDLTQLNQNNIDLQPYVNENLTNVFIQIQNSSNAADCGTFGPVRLASNGYLHKVAYSVNTGALANCTVPAYINVCLNGTTPTYTYAIGAPLPVTSIPTMLLNNFTPYYRRNWTFRGQINGNLVPFSGQTGTLQVYCPTLSEFQINLTAAAPTGGPLIIQTIEQPKNFVTYNSVLPYVRQDSTNFLQDNYYISTSQVSMPFVFQLLDYTGGQCYKSTATFYRTVNNSLLGIVWVETFDASNYIYPNLVNGTQYTIMLNCNGNIRNLGPQWIQDPSTVKSIVATAPQMTNINQRWVGLNMSINSDYNTAQISCVYTVNPPIYNATMDIYNVSTNSLIYSTSSQQLSASLIYTANVNNTYLAKCYIKDATYNTRELDQYINFRNQSAYWKGFNLNVPPTVLGISRNLFLIGLGLIGALLLAATFNELNYGIGGIVVALIFGFFAYVGWFAELNTSWWLVSIAISLGVAIQLSRNRQGVYG